MGVIIKNKLYRKGKLTIFLFHIAFVLILAGAAITRFIGYEGTINIREGQTTDQFFLSGDYLGGDHDGEKKLKRLVIAISWDFLDRRAFIWHDIRNFTNLMEVTILADRSEADEIMQAGAARSFHFLAREHKEWNPPKVLIGDPASGTVWEEFGPEAV